MANLNIIQLRISHSDDAANGVAISRPCSECFISPIIRSKTKERKRNEPARGATMQLQLDTLTDVDIVDFDLNIP